MVSYTIFPAASISCFRNTIRVSNGLDLDQDRHSVDPDLGPNCKQELGIVRCIFRITTVW